jgi:uncharacterized protein with beta-barrel porin domain
LFAPWRWEKAEMLGSDLERFEVTRAFDMPAQRNARRLISALLVGTALTAVACLAGAPAWAQAIGAGGNGGSAFGASGAAGGTGFTGNAGSPGDTFVSVGPGGGGGSAGGGAGGNGGSAGGGGGTGGTPGPLTANGGIGGNGSGDDLGGGGGGGGANGNGAGIPNLSTGMPFIVGGSGGKGGDGGSPLGTGASGGGGGGAGGFGAIVTGSGASNVNPGGVVVGGNGGTGGNAGGAGSGAASGGGNGGAGGVGILFTAPGATLTNVGDVFGGEGGSGGNGVNGGAKGTPGAGGAGIVGSGLVVINDGRIIGGSSGDNTILANAITFTGGTNILEIQVDSSITGHVVAFSAADTLRLGGVNIASFDVAQIGTQYLGFGIFQKTGSGVWTLTGVNTAALPWTVNAGTLNVTGALTNSAMTVNNGGTLTGTGIVGATTVNSGGIFAPGGGSIFTFTAPGGAPGFMTVTGNLALQSGAQYLVALNPTTSSFASVTGTATLGGATVNAMFANGSYVAKQYTILTATGGVNGTFGSVADINLPTGFKTALSYDKNDAFLNLSLAFVPPPGSGLNGNQQAVGNAIVNFFNTTGGIPMAFGALTPAGLTQVSGELATGSQQTTFDAMNLFMGLMTDPFVAGRGDGPTSGGSAPTGYASTQAAGPARDAYAMFTKAPPFTPFEQRWSVWSAGFGGSQTTDGNAALGSNNTTSSVYGTAVGMDYRLSPFTTAGFALAGGGTNFSVAGSGSGHSDLFQAGAFIRHTVGAAYISAALAYGWQDITTTRTVTAAGSDQLRAQFDANAFSGRLEGGYRFVMPWVGGIGITPYAAAQFTTFDLPDYAEQAIVGSNAFALTYNAKDVTDTRSELGIRTDQSWAMTDGILTLRGRVAWAHDFDPDRSIAATFQALPGASFVVNGASQASDSALVTASLEKKWLTGWSAAATFEGEFSDVTRSYAGKGVVRYQW